MRDLKKIIKEQTLNLNNAQKGIIASMAIAPTPQMAYGVVTGARNAVAEKRTLQAAGYIRVNDTEKTAELTDEGKDVLTSENLLDDTDQLTDRGEELVAQYREDTGEWQRFESFRYFS